MHVKKGDNVIVLAGDSKGKTGKIIKAIPDKNMVVVDGVNMKKKSRKAASKEGKGQVVEIAMPIHVSNVKKK